MRLSEIGNKEIVDLSTGCSHGQLWDAEMLFDEKTRVIKSLLVPDLTGGVSSRFKGDIQLPWSSIIVIGEDMIIFRSI